MPGGSPERIQVAYGEILHAGDQQAKTRSPMGHKKSNEKRIDSISRIHVFSTSQGR